jgi:hypothetical protein
MIQAFSILFKRGSMAPAIGHRRGGSVEWRLIAALSALGALTGSLSVLGVTAGNERRFGAGLVVVWATILSIRAVHDPFLHGLVVGVLSETAGALVQVSFLGVYLRNNPHVALRLQAVARLPVPAAILIGGVVAGVLTGVMAGALAAGAAWTRPRLPW